MSSLANLGINLILGQKNSFLFFIWIDNKKKGSVNTVLSQAKKVTSIVGKREQLSEGEEKKKLWEDRRS